MSSLHEMLSSSDAIIRARSAFLLGRIASPDSVEPLARLLKDPERSVRIQSGIALACMGDDRGIPVCAAALKSEPSWVRYYAVYGLWRTDSSRAKRILKDIHDGDKFVDETIREALKTRYVSPPTVEKDTTEPQHKPPVDTIRRDAADVFILEADWWWHQGDYDQTIRCHEAVVFLCPSYVDSYSGIAWLQWSMGRDMAAVNTLERGIAANPSSPDAYYNLGFHYYNTKRYRLALEPLSKAVEFGGDHLARRNYAHCLERCGKLEKSLEQWSILVKLLPEDGAARLNYERVKRLVEGIETE